MSKDNEKKPLKHTGFSEEMQPVMEATALSMEKFIKEALAEHKKNKGKRKVNK